LQPAKWYSRWASNFGAQPGEDCTLCNPCELPHSFLAVSEGRSAFGESKTKPCGQAPYQQTCGVGKACCDDYSFPNHCAFYYANVVCTIVDVEGKEPRRRLLHASINHKESGQQGRPRSCPICGGQHAVRDCREFNGALPPDRWRYVRGHRLCFMCLQSGHMNTSYSSHSECQFNGCWQRHHSMLHQADSQRRRCSNKAAIEGTTREVTNNEVTPQSVEAPV